MKRALILVDLQYDFMPTGALSVKKADEIIPIINSFIGKFPLVVASQDWHSENHISFAKIHDRKVGDRIEVDGIEQILWPVHCVEHTPGAALIKELNQDRICKCFYKGIDPCVDSYSAFFDNKRKRKTGLDAFLREKNVSEIFLAGLTTEYCVMYTALDGLEMGYKVVLIADACRPVNLKPHDEKNAVKKMKQVGIEIIQSTAL